ncbi:hypothetical protein ACB094_07G141000 [Castanea mollissima]
MGCNRGCNRGCCRPTSPGSGCDGLTKVLLFFVVVLILLCTPKLFVTYEPVVEQPKETVRARIVWPLVLIAIVFLLVMIVLGDCKSRSCKRCHRYSSKGCFCGVWRNDYGNVSCY